MFNDSNINSVSSDNIDSVRSRMERRRLDEFRSMKRRTVATLLAAVIVYYVLFITTVCRVGSMEDIKWLVLHAVNSVMALRGMAWFDIFASMTVFYILAGLFPFLLIGYVWCQFCLFEAVLRAQPLPFLIRPVIQQETVPDMSVSYNEINTEIGNCNFLSEIPAADKS